MTESDPERTLMTRNAGVDADISTGCGVVSDRHLLLSHFLASVIETGTAPACGWSIIASQRREDGLITRDRLTRWAHHPDGLRAGAARNRLAVG